MRKAEVERMHHSELRKKDMPSAVDDAANVMSKYHKKNKKTKKTKDQKYSFPEIDYEKPPHY